MRIGVTGIFASGKGTVCAMFQELGAKVVDTDEVAREVVEPGSAGIQLIELEFGKKFINADGGLDRRKFANHVFQNEVLVEKLNSITHPLILDLVIQRSGGDDIYMINTPLLFESGFNNYMDKNIVVVAADDQVIKRGIKRDNISEREIRDRLQHQISLNEKKELADYVIDNSKGLDNTKRQVTDLWNILNRIKAE